MKQTLAAEVRTAYVLHAMAQGMSAWWSSFDALACACRGTEKAPGSPATCCS